MINSRYNIYNNIKGHDNDNYYYKKRHTDPGVFSLSLDQIAEIELAYCQNVSDRGLPYAVIKEIERAIKSGILMEHIIEAIEKTGVAPSPSPAYLRRILQNWRTYGYTDDFDTFRQVKAREDLPF